MQLFQLQKYLPLSTFDPSHTFVRVGIATFNFTTLPKCDFNPWSTTMPEGMFPCACFLMNAEFDGHPMIFAGFSHAHPMSIY